MDVYWDTAYCMYMHACGNRPLLGGGIGRKSLMLRIDTQGERRERTFRLVHRQKPRWGEGCSKWGWGIEGKARERGRRPGHGRGREDGDRETTDGARSQARRGQDEDASAGDAPRSRQDRTRRTQAATARGGRRAHSRGEGQGEAGWGGGRWAKTRGGIHAWPRAAREAQERAQSAPNAADAPRAPGHVLWRAGLRRNGGSQRATESTLAPHRPPTVSTRDGGGMRAAARARAGGRGVG